MTVAPTPTWPTCGQSDCRGVLVRERGRCLAHVSAADRQIALLSVTAGSRADFRGVPLTSELIVELRRWTHGVLYDARFDQAVFSGDANFRGFVFSGRADFRDASFQGAANFEGACFRGGAEFGRAVFEEDAGFDGVSFEAAVDFSRAQFRGALAMNGAYVTGSLDLSRARCSGPVEGMVFCTEEVRLRGAQLEQPVRLQLAVPRLHCREVTFLASSELLVQRAEVDLTDANLAARLSLFQHYGLFRLPDGSHMDEVWLRRRLSGFRMSELVSVRGADLSYLTLVDMSLRRCVFFGAHHLDQIRISGECYFASPRRSWGVHGGIPLRWAKRRAIADEHLLRRTVEYRARNREAWVEVTDDLPGTVMEPAHVAQLYRQLRKALEDNKDEPGAADFYYGEMEMRRLDRTETTRAERWLLHAYWLLSGYGLRASRALAWLLLAMCATMVLMLGLGLPDQSPDQTVSGNLPRGGGHVTLEIDKPSPALTLPLADRFSSERFEKTLRIVLNSVIFRSSGQELTMWGTYIEMVSRFIEPVLLGLAVLAMRGRIKRG
ncbi:pentapeptide repeat-containing protein [Streptomyces sp. NBC_01017]|uniref:pentapeptide repeat-containing protein n=1 Tax=Streptomyces sp. NBC_01017 TaxID=2903721 RepID=UPI00386F7B54|nr:pentapeptide repeat-containing protein [Streptomyces sp. NBC_01017]